MRIVKDNMLIRDVKAIADKYARHTSDMLVEHGLSVLEGFTVDEKRVLEDNVRESLIVSIASLTGNPNISSSCSNCIYATQGMFKDRLNCSKGVSIGARGVPLTYKCQFYKGDLVDN